MTEDTEFTSPPDDGEGDPPLTRIGPYELHEQLGAGGMGTVYHAKHRETGQFAAVKVLPPSLARESGFLARFVREIEALKKLDNPHIIELYDSGVDGEMYYYAMEYVPGETLTRRLERDRRVSWPEAIEIALQVCKALKAAHDTGIVHRDLKPSNLLITADGTVKLSDFGVAHIFAANKLTATGGVVGTAEFMSPEQAQGQRATKKSDLYSLGAVMYMMLTGRPPFTGRTTLDVMHRHRYGQFDRPRRLVPDIPRWLDEITCQLLEKDPEKRFPDAYVLSRRLQEVVRKVELAQSEATYGSGESYDGSAPTVSLDERRQSSAAAAVPQGGAVGSATLMRDFMQAELERTQRKSFPGNLLDNTWVLLALLGLLITGGVLWVQSRHMSPEERFQAGVELMERPPGPAWRTAREEYFEPLVESNPERWRDKAEPYLQRIEEHEWQENFLARLRRAQRSIPANDAERFLQRAQEALEKGEFARAERTLTALQPLIEGQPEFDAYRPVAARLLEELRARREERPSEDVLLRESLSRARQLADEGRLEEVRTVCKAIVSLYDSDPAAEEAVRRARSLLQRTDSQNAEQRESDPP